MSHPHDPNDPQCRAMFAKLSEYIDLELDSGSCAEIERHLADCLPCQACLETLKRTASLCGKMTPQPVPHRFSEKLRELAAAIVEQSGT